jgi:hypothetical protein
MNLFRRGGNGGYDVEATAFFLAYHPRAASM